MASVVISFAIGAGAAVGTLGAEEEHGARTAHPAVGRSEGRKFISIHNGISLLRAR